MPFVSKKQQRFAFGTGQPWAKEWADKTDFKSLPESADKKGAGPVLHDCPNYGPGHKMAGHMGMRACPRCC